MKTLIALALGLAASGAALATPSDIAAEYNLSFTGITIGHVSETYSRTGDRYAIRSVARAEGPLKMFLDDQLTLSSGRKVELYTYRLVDEPHIATPAGEFDTLHYERVTAGPRESKAEVWLAKDRFNFPVRVEFTDPKGFRVEQTLVGLTAR